MKLILKYAPSMIRKQKTDHKCWLLQKCNQCMECCLSVYWALRCWDVHLYCYTSVYLQNQGGLYWMMCIHCVYCRSVCAEVVTSYMSARWRLSVCSSLQQGDQFLHDRGFISTPGLFTFRYCRQLLFKNTEHCHKAIKLLIRVLDLFRSGCIKEKKVIYVSN